MPHWRDGSALRSRSFADRRRRRCRSVAAQFARPRAPCRGARLPALLDGRASQSARHRQRGDRGGARPCRGRHEHDPDRRRRHHAAEPRAAGDRRAVRHPRRAASRAGRAGARPRAGVGSDHRAGDAPHPARRRRRVSAGCRRADGLFPAGRAGPGGAGGSRRRARGADLDPRLEHLSARSSRRSRACRSPSPRISRRR